MLYPRPPLYNIYVRYTVPVKTSHIRPLDSRRDLTVVADLIELCFASSLDQDGRDYLRHIRRAAADPGLIRWTIGRGERVSTPLFGYVWEDGHRLIGNLSLIPIYKNGHWLYMIANVAVHPDFRRRGIARELTLRAIEHVREHKVPSTWLQVRHDNAAAYNLYASIGFVERSRRSTWMSGSLPALKLPVGVQVTPRDAADWGQQLAWLELNYPTDTVWNTNFDAGRYRPAWWNQLLVWLNGDVQTHWAARYGGNGSGPEETLGFTTWEPNRGYNDMLWVAAPPEHDDTALRALLPYAMHYLEQRRRPLGVNYPEERGVDSFYACGFNLQHTLVWMEYPCK